MQSGKRRIKENKSSPLNWEVSNDIDWQILKIIAESFEFNFESLLKQHNIDTRMLPTPAPSSSPLEAEVNLSKKWHILFVKLAERCNDQVVAKYISEKLQTYMLIVQNAPQLSPHLLKKINLCFVKITALLDNVRKKNVRYVAGINMMIFSTLFDFLSSQNIQAIEHTIQHIQNENDYNEAIKYCDQQLVFESLLETNSVINMLGEGTNRAIPNRFNFKFLLMTLIFEMITKKYADLKKENIQAFVSRNKQLRSMLDDYYRKHGDHHLYDDIIGQDLITAQFYYFYYNCIVARFEKNYTELHNNFLNLYRWIKKIKAPQGQCQPALELCHAMINYFFSKDSQKELFAYLDIGRELLDLCKQHLGDNPDLRNKRIEFDGIEKKIWEEKIKRLQLDEVSVTHNFPFSVSLMFSSIEQATSYQVACAELGVAVNINDRTITFSAFKQLTKRHLAKITDQYQVNLHNMLTTPQQATSSVKTSEVGTSAPKKPIVQTPSVSTLSLFDKPAKPTKKVVWKEKGLPAYTPDSKKNRVYKLHASFLKNSLYVYISPALERELSKQDTGKEFEALKRCVEKGKIWKGKGSGILIKDKKIKVKDNSKDVRLFGREVAVVEKDGKRRHLFVIDSYKKHNHKTAMVSK